MREAASLEYGLYSNPTNIWNRGKNMRFQQKEELCEQIWQTSAGKHSWTKYTESVI